MWAELVGCGMDLAARQLLRALRGDRSQLAFSRRLGFRSAVAADWEAGRRSPTADQVLHAASRVGVDVPAAIAAFHPAAADAWAPGPDGLAAWLRRLQGDTSVTEIAARTALTRHQVGRALAGTTHPRLPAFLEILDALTGRAPDLVAGLVDIDAVPALAPRHHAMQRAARLAWDTPWAMAVLMQLQVGVPVVGAAAHVAAALGIPEALAATCLRELQAARLAAPSGTRWAVLATPTVQTPDAATHAAWVRAWADVAASRREAPDSTVNLNVFSVGARDLERIREVQRRAFREVQGIVAESEPVDVVAMVLWQVSALGPGGG
ncbi:MAG: helix-turn-helix transcriptional regulator [Alphaproteobacteria bacterium]|nr:helix-turn-helix transcriptional regulator [Alphaproteobacteria bacterium]